MIYFRENSHRNRLILNPINYSNLNNKIAVIVVACKRETLDICMNSIVQNHEYLNPLFNFYVSDGCVTNPKIKTIVEKYQNFKYLTFNLPQKIILGYEKISYHYKLFLNHIFDCLNYTSDFLNYFLKMSPLLENDESLFCISAWHDNGLAQYAHGNIYPVHIDPYKFMRTDLFPGLGWMLTRRFWDEIKSNWPKAYWDEYLRISDSRKNRTCIYPEISRVRNFGSVGMNEIIFFDNFIKPIINNVFPVNYDLVNLKKLSKSEFEQDFYHAFNNSVDITQQQYFGLEDFSKKISYKIKYSSKSEFEQIYKYLAITHTTRYTLPRASYNRITHLNRNTHHLFLYPQSDNTLS
ncbi:hypothetical protein HZS_1817 [Henneguya salminicola]|nr:hypothetical protein HZS_1817 [Henneguya salminicola]